MALPTPEPGLVIAYSYLWHAAHEAGYEEGLKTRPCVIIAVYREDTKLWVTVAPVTHSAPLQAQEAVEIPQVTKQRVGLDTDRSWVMVTEVNDFVWPGPDLRPIAPGRFEYGLLPPNLFRQIRDRMRAQGATGGLKNVPRSE